MLSDSKQNFDFLFSNGKIKTDRLNVRGFKVYADGALGSRGACLLEPYSDKPGWGGFLLSSEKHFEKNVRKCRPHGAMHIQLCYFFILSCGLNFK